MTDAAPVEQDDLEDLDESHFLRLNWRPEMCWACGEAWPCRTHRLIQTVATLQRELAEARADIEAWTDKYVKAVMWISRALYYLGPQDVSGTPTSRERIVNANGA